MSADDPTPTDKARCLNLMEILVKREIFQQLKKIPANTARYIQPGEVATFALNRLPPLYVSSEQGKIYQLDRAKAFQPKIRAAVLQGIAAVLRDPLRKSTPLQLSQRDVYAEAFSLVLALEGFVKKRRNLPKQQKLTVEEIGDLAMKLFNDYDLALAQLEDLLSQYGFRYGTITPQNVIPILKSALHRLSLPFQHQGNEQSLGQREAEFLEHHGGEVDDEPSELRSDVRNWYIQ